MEALEIQHLCKSYGETHVLNGVSLAIAEGQITCLLGPNGAGKTTIIRILCGLTKYSQGQIRLFNQDVSKKSHASIKKIGYVAQSVNLDNTMSILDNLVFQASLYGIPKKEAMPTIEQYLEQFELTKQMHKNVQRLSGGQRRCVDIIMGLVQKPRILILDEPTTNLDPETRHKLWSNLIKEQQQSKLTILFSTHYLDEADKYSDRIIFVNKGKVVADGTAETLKNSIGNEVVIIEMKSKDYIPEATKLIADLDVSIDSKIAGSKIILTHPNISNMLSKTIATLYNNNIDVQKIMLSRPSLDDVYLMITGESFELAHAASTPQVPMMFGRVS